MDPGDGPQVIKLGGDSSAIVFFFFGGGIVNMYALKIVKKMASKPSKRNKACLEY